MEGKNETRKYVTVFRTKFLGFLLREKGKKLKHFTGELQETSTGTDYYNETKRDTGRERWKVKHRKKVLRE